MIMMSVFIAQVRNTDMTVKKLGCLKIMVLLKKYFKQFQIVDFDTSHLNKNVTFLVYHYYDIYLHY